MDGWIHRSMYIHIYKLQAILQYFKLNSLADISRMVQFESNKARDWSQAF